MRNFYREILKNLNGYEGEVKVKLGPDTVAVCGSRADLWLVGPWRLCWGWTHLSWHRAGVTPMLPQFYLPHAPIHQPSWRKGEQLCADCLNWTQACGFVVGDSNHFTAEALKEKKKYTKTCCMVFYSSENILTTLALEELTTTTKWCWLDSS